MLQYNPSISGSLSVTGSLIVTNGVIGTVNGVDVEIFSSSISQVVTNIQTTTGSQSGRLTSIESFTSSVSTTNTFTSSTSARLGSIETVSASNISRLNAVETITASNISRLNSIETITASNISRLTSLEITTGSLATTGSNTFIGTQTITGSLFISSNLIVQGTSSLQNITASAVSIGTNLINLNTANPAIRYAGLVIGDSGSVGGSGSFLYDSVQDEMIFVHRGDSSVVTSSVTLMGPETYDNVGNETYPTLNIIQKGTGKEHLVDSCIFDNGTTTCIKNNLVGTGTISGTTIYGSTTVCSPTLVVSNQTNISPDANGVGQLMIQGNGYQGYTALDATAMYIGHNSQIRNLTLQTNETNRLTINGDGIACFSCTICAPIVSVGSCLLINQTCSLLDITTKVEMSGVGAATAFSQASYNVFANHGTNSTWIGYLSFHKSRGTTQGSVTAVVDGDRIGMIRFSGADGSEQIRATEIYSEVDGAVSKCCVPGRIIFATTGNNLNGPIERMRITCGGNVYIGATTGTYPTSGYMLGIRATGGVQTFMSITAPGEALDSQGLVIGVDASAASFYMRDAKFMNFFTTNLERMRITSAGVACFSSTVCVPSLRVQSAFADLVLCGSNTTSPHLGSTFSITTNQDALGRTIIGNGSVGRAIYLESNGQTIFNCGAKFGNGSGCLNYYEQGSFSPTFAGSTSGCAIPSGTNSALGYYTRIGNQVFITVAVNSSTFPSYSGDLKMYLPFTACNQGGLSSVTYHGPPIYFYPYANWGSTYCINDITPYILGANNFLGFNIYGTGGDRQAAITSSNTNLSGQAGIYVRFSINYTAV